MPGTCTLPIVGNTIALVIVHRKPVMGGRSYCSENCNWNVPFFSQEDDNVAGGSDIAPMDPSGHSVVRFGDVDFEGSGVHGNLFVVEFFFLGDRRGVPSNGNKFPTTIKVCWQLHITTDWTTTAC